MSVLIFQVRFELSKGNSIVGRHEFLRYFKLLPEDPIGFELLQQFGNGCALLSRRKNRYAKHENEQDGLHLVNFEAAMPSLST